jgi:hypothetical protein
MSSVNALCMNEDRADGNDHDFIVRLIAICGAKQTKHIMIANRRAIQTATNLYKRGVRHGMCRTADSSPYAGASRADSLWIVNAPSETELGVLIAMLGQDSRADGTLVVGFEVPISSDHASCLRRALVDRGFAPVCEEIDSAGRTFLVYGGQQARAHARTA